MSATELVVGYLAERAKPNVFVPLALLVAGTAWLVAPGTAATALSFAVCTAQALMFIFALRIWDDLQDRDRDAIRHPHRLAVRAHSTAPLIALAGALAASGTLWLLGATVPLLRITILIAIVFGLLVWYRIRPAESSRWTGAVLLMKYPALAILLAPGLGELSPARAALVGGGLYVITWAYELLEDRSRGMP